MRVKVAGTKIELDGKDITESVRVLEIKLTDHAEVTLTMVADLEAELEAELVALEKVDHVRFTSLNNQKRFVRNRL
jgi:hypothetical protein